MLREHRSAVLVLPAIALLTALFVFPLIDVFKLSLFSPELSLKNFEQFFGTSVYLRVFFNTMQLSVVVTALSVVVGYPAAYILAKTDPGFRPYLIFLILIPFWSSILVRSYTWIVLLGREGVVNSLLQALSVANEPIKMLYTTGAVYVAMVQILLPIMILTCYSVMVEIDLGLVRAARVLGASAGRAFLHVFLPLSLSGVSTGAIIIFILSTGFFITPALVGGPKDIMIANLIDFQLNQTVNWGLASAMAVVLLVSTMTVVLLFRLATRSDYLAR